MASTGIRELKDNLSRFIRRVEAGERIAITAHGRIVAELVPPGANTKGGASRFDQLVASGIRLDDRGGGTAILRARAGARLTADEERAAVGALRGQVDRGTYAVSLTLESVQLTRLVNRFN